MTDREAVIALNLISGIGYVKYQSLVDYFGSPGAIFGAGVAELSQVHGIGATLAGKIAGFGSDDLAMELDYVDRGGARLITLLDETYPEELRSLYDPPLCLYVRGTLPIMGDHAVAIVGSRNVSEYGKRMTRQFAMDAALANLVVVSGLAYGTDGEAHAATLSANGVTVAVLGGGLARIHPQEHVGLARAIVESGGALISEFPMTFPVSRTSFPRRNRIVSGLSCATIVIEAGVKSGALITANCALEQGREVFAVPGRADNPNAKGCHMLIRNGATLVEDMSQVLESLHGGIQSEFSLREPAQNYDPDSFDDLNDAERELVGLIRQGAVTMEALSVAFADKKASLLGLLMALEMRLIIRRNADGSYEVAG